MNIRLFISELMSGNNQYNQLNRFFFHLTPSGILFMIFSLILVSFLFWFFISIYKNTIAKTRLFQKHFKTGHSSIPNSGFDKVDFYFIGFVVSLLPVLCIMSFLFSNVSMFQAYARESEAVDSLQRKDIFENYDSKVVVTGNYRYSNYTENEVENVFLVLEKKDKSSFYSNPYYLQPVNKVELSIDGVGDRGFKLVDTNVDFLPPRKFFIKKEDAPEIYKKILKYKKEIESKTERN